MADSMVQVTADVEEQLRQITIEKAAAVAAATKG